MKIKKYHADVTLQNPIERVKIDPSNYLFLNQEVPKCQQMFFSFVFFCAWNVYFFLANIKEYSLQNPIERVKIDPSNTQTHDSLLSHFVTTVT
jgi:hypothetical protein